MEKKHSPSDEDIPLNPQSPSLPSPLNSLPSKGIDRFAPHVNDPSFSDFVGSQEEESSQPNIFAATPDTTHVGPLNNTNNDSSVLQSNPTSGDDCGDSQTQAFLSVVGEGSQRSSILEECVAGFGFHAAFHDSSEMEEEIGSKRSDVSLQQSESQTSIESFKAATREIIQVNQDKMDGGKMDDINENKIKENQMKESEILRNEEIQSQQEEQSESKVNEHQNEDKNRTNEDQRDLSSLRNSISDSNVELESLESVTVESPRLTEFATPLIESESEAELSELPPPSIEHRGSGPLATTTGEQLPTSSGADSAHDAKLEMLMVKKSAYLRLKDWEEDRLTRSEKFHRILDPLVDELIVGVQTAKDTHALLVKFLKDRSKIAGDTAGKLRASSLALPKLQRHSSQTGTTTPVPASTETTVNETDSRPQTPPHSTSYPPPWIRALYRCNQKEAAFLTAFGEGLESTIIQGKLLGPTDDYEKASTMLLIKLKETRAKLWAQNKEVRKAWYDFQKLFKEVEKVQYNHSQSATGKSAMKESQIQSKDTWLAERKYLHSALISNQMQSTYMKLVGQGVADTQQLDKWRTEVLKDCIVTYMAKMRETLGLVASSLGGAHNLIDPEGFLKAKVEFLSRHPTSTNSPSPPFGEVDEAKEASPESPRFAEVRTNFNIDTDPSFVEARALVESIEVPEAQLVIKKAHVRRHAGIFGRWSEGLLVLTWDRQLHMFRSFDDPQPVWTVSVPSVEVRLVEDKGIKTVEIRDKKNLFVVLGSKSFYFRAYSDDDLESWLRCLSLAVSADDRVYRIEGLANARNADQRAFDEYTNWIHHQESVNMSEIYGNDELASFEEERKE